MQLTKLRAAPVWQAEVPPCAPAGRMDGGTASQLIRGVRRTTPGSRGATSNQSTKGGAVAEVSSVVMEFFDAYARSTTSFDPAFLESAYADAFMFAGPSAVHALKRDEFLKVVPKRRAFFTAVGLVSSEVRRLEETALDQQHGTVRGHR